MNDLMDLAPTQETVSYLDETFHDKKIYGNYIKANFFKEYPSFFTYNPEVITTYLISDAIEFNTSSYLNSLNNFEWDNEYENEDYNPYIKMKVEESRKVKIKVKSVSEFKPNINLD